MPDFKLNFSDYYMAFSIKKASANWLKILKQTFEEFNAHNPFMLSAALSYYAIFSLPALLVIVIYLAGAIFGAEAIAGKVFGQVNGLIGAEGALQVQTMITNAALNKNAAFWPTVIGVVTLFVSSTAVFVQLQQTLNSIWGISIKPGRAIIRYILDRVFSFGLIASFCFLLLISLVVTSFLSMLHDVMTSKLGESFAILLDIANVLISLGIYSVLFGMIYKILPDAKIAWRDVIYGGFFTSILFMIGRFLIGFYLGKSNPGSSYGAAGSVIVIMLWVSYSSMILFLGAVFTKVNMETANRYIEPNSYAEKVAGMIPAGLSGSAKQELVADMKAENKVNHIPTTGKVKVGEDHS